MKKCNNIFCELHSSNGGSKGETNCGLFYIDPYSKDNKEGFNPDECKTRKRYEAHSHHLNNKDIIHKRLWQCFSNSQTYCGVNAEISNISYRWKNVTCKKCLENISNGRLYYNGKNRWY